MNIFKDRFLALSLLAGLLIRFLITPTIGFKFDVDTWFYWAERLNTVGFSQFYSDQIWTGYTPGYLYILGFLGFIKKLFLVADPQFFVILKLPSILSEVIIGFIVYKIIPKNFGVWRKLGLLLIVFNPAFIFNSSIFGQFDGLFSLSLLISIYFLNRRNLIYSSAMSGISFLLKPQAMLLIPIFTLYFLKNTRGYLSTKFIYLVLPAPLIIIIGFFPFFSSNFINGPIKLLTALLDFYPYNSIFAYNFWGIFGFWLGDQNKWQNINYQNWGYILFGIFWACVAFEYLWRKRNLSIYSLSALSALSFFFLLTRMHERYLYPAVVFLILVATLRRSRLLVILSSILSLIYLLDLYYVYIYYNLFYLKLPTNIYNQIVYNFANDNVRLISLFSTFIFFLTSYIILKLRHDSKTT